MILAERLQAIREEKHLSQEDVEKRAGLVRCYVSEVESGVTVPDIEMMEELASALRVPLFKLFYEDQEPVALLNLPMRLTADDIILRSIYHKRRK